MRGRLVMAGAAIVLGVGCSQPVFSPSSPPANPPAPQAPTQAAGTPFSSTSFWYRALGASPAPDPNSPALVANFNAAAANGVGINNDSYSIPIYTVP
ncbi:MAG TPA: hypothetical protein VG869_12535, partial [Acidimicrobiia bacterium]|nr:hypothetical protein [Acidimicrobiia bacterium]